MSEILPPKVGVGLFIVRGDEVLMGKRISKHGTGEFAGPGGHVDPGENPHEAVLREKSEEAGDDLQIGPLRMLCVSSLVRYLPKHYIDIGFAAEWVSGEPIVMEPEKLESWDWYPIDALPEPLFENIDKYVEAYRGGKMYFPHVTPEVE